MLLTQVNAGRRRRRLTLLGRRVMTMGLRLLLWGLALGLTLWLFRPLG